MKFMMEYPIQSEVDTGTWVNPANIAEFARVAEASGVDGLAFTDHPAPSAKWLAGGGHETFDPFVALGYLAGVTTTLRLMTHLTVLPYRNPFLNAKAMTAVDVLSGGRSTFVLGTGYLRSEFAALGVDFAERNALFDEAVEVMKGVWSSDDFRYEGRHFNALGVTLRPGPVQKPHPPLWLGGNAGVVRDRVAAWGSGWAPLLGSPVVTRTSRTREINSDEELAGFIRQIGDQMEENGRDPKFLDVAATSLSPLPENPSVDQQIDALGRLAEIGVTWTHVRVPLTEFAAALDGLRQHGEEIAANAKSL
jgi:probable F420-dependent oxidoreductase